MLLLLVSCGLKFSFNCSVLIQKKAMDISPELKGTSIFLVGKNHLMLSDASELIDLMVIMVMYLCAWCDDWFGVKG